MKRILATVLLSALSFTSSAIELFNWQAPKAANKTTSQFMSSQAYSNAQIFSVDTRLLRDHKINDIITINLAANEHYQAKITKIKRKQNGIVHIFAKINHQKETTPVVLTLGKSQFFFRIVTDNHVYVAQGNNNQGKLLNEQWLTKENNNHTNDVKIPQESPRYSQKATQKQIATDYSRKNSSTALPHLISKNSTLNAARKNNDMATIKVLFVYSLSAETLYDGDVFTRLNHLVEVTNQIYLDSEVNMQIEITDTLAVDYPDEILSEQALDDITYQTHEAFTNIENIRFEAGADMVALLRPNMDADTVCGIAWGNNEVNNSIGFMYSHTSIDCPDYVNAHEMGHNMGLAHSQAQGNEGYSFPFARGYRISDPENGFSTVMAYSVSNAGKIYKFSNPEILCTELACGIDRNDTVNGADASYALNQLRFQLANIMDTETNLTLASEALNTIESEGLKSCLENQINNYDITYAGQVRNIFCSYRNISSLAGLENFNGLTSLYLNGNNLTDLSALSSLTKLSTLNLSDSNISNLASLSTLLYLNNLTLSGNQITSLNGLENLNFLTYLNVTDNQISEIGALSNQLYLETLLLDNNQITEITALQALENLNWLSLSNNKITDLPSLTKLAKLTNFNIAENQITNLDGVIALRRMENLDIENNMISDLTPLKSFRDLQTLTISNNPIADLDSMVYLYNLTTLNATNTNITDLSALFNLHNTWTQIRLFDSNNIYCWQVNYVDQFINYENYQQPNSCDTNTDSQDFDNDGISNIEEINNNTNPLYNSEQAGKLEFQIESLYLTETEKTINLKVIRSFGNMGKIKVDVRTNNQTALAGEDFTALDQPLTFANNELFKTFSIDISGDAIYENNETFEIELLNPESASLGEKSTLTVTLQDKGGVAISWLETTNVVNENANTLTLTVTRPDDSVGEMSVDINFVDNTAINGIDYIFENQTVTFLDGEYSKEIDVVILDNDEYQEERNFNLVMTNPINAYIEDNTQHTTIEIIDDDTPAKGIVSFETSSLAFNESDGEVAISLQRVDGEFGDLVINYDIADITTTQGNDYTLSSGTLTFQNGEIDKTITLAITNDDNDENDESFTITLMAEDASTLGEVDEITISIIDNDETVVTPPTTTPTTPSDSGSGGGGSMFHLLMLIIISLYNSRRKLN